MKHLLPIILVLLLLTGCGGPHLELPLPEQSTPESSETVIQETLPLTFLDRKQPFGIGTNLWEIPGTPISEMEFPQLVILGDVLIMGNAFYDPIPENTEYTEGYENEYGEVPPEDLGEPPVVCQYRLKAVDLHDGTVLGEYGFDSSGSVTLQAFGDRVAVIECGLGRVIILDDHLQVQNDYQADFPYGDCYLSPDLCRLYDFSWGHGLIFCNLQTGESANLLPDGAEIYAVGYGDDLVMFGYIHIPTQKYRQCSLDLRTGTITEHPADFVMTGAHPLGDSWLCSDLSDYRVNHIVSADRHQILRFDGDYIDTIPEREQILTSGDYFNSLRLFDRDGRFLSEARLPEGYTAISYSICWSDLWNGYFIACSDAEFHGHLLFWDIRQPVLGNDLILNDYSPSAPGGFTAAPDLYTRAAALSEKYGLDIRIADQCALDYDDYYAYEINDSVQLRDNLDILERVLSHYPDGFFSQLCYGKIGSIRIELVGGLQRKNLPEDAAFQSFVGFAQEKGSYYLMVVDIAEAYADTYYHEFSHIIDDRLIWDATYRQDALFSEEDWLKLQPSGFEYAYSYEYLPDNIFNPDYFIDDYSCTFPTEDRARIMEYSMGEWYDFFPSGSPLASKLDYYSRCIRDTFDTTGWPQITAWEKPLSAGN